MIANKQCLLKNDGYSASSAAQSVAEKYRKKNQYKSQLAREIHYQSMSLKIVVLKKEAESGYVCAYVNIITSVQMTGIGYSLNAKLSSLGVSTCSELQKLSLAFLQKQFGMKTGQSLYKCCRGTDERTFRTGAERKSVSAEMNYGIRFTTVSRRFNAVACLMKQLKHFLLC